MRYLIKSIFLLLGLPNVYAPMVYANTTLNNLQNRIPNFPACTNQDYDWYQKSQPDFVQKVAPESTELVLTAGSISGQESATHIIDGNVVGYKEDKSLQANWLIYNQKNSRVQGGNVVLNRQYDSVTGQWVDYYVDLDKGELIDAKARNYKSDMYVEGQKINIYDKKHFKVRDAYFTTCDPNDPSWHIRAKQVTFDYQNSKGTARSVTFYAESVPIMKFPYLSFPLGERKTGFLYPLFGGGGGGPSAFFLGIPFYWNMAPNYDMTIGARYYNSDGLMLSDQFRYLTENGHGQLYTEQVPSDPATPSYSYRNYWHLEDQHTYLKDLHVGYAYNSVSDNNYFVDFGNLYSYVSNIDLDQSVYLNYTPNWGTIGALIQNYQALQPSNTQQYVTTAPIYEMEPQLNFNVNPLALAGTGLDIGLVSQYTNFAGGGGGLQNGQRLEIYPSVTYPLKKQWGYITPKFGYNYTNYVLAPFPTFQNNYSTVDRDLPITSLDSGLTFDREMTLAQSNYVQTLEPRLYYLYIPYVNQGNIPVFDTAMSTINLNELFTENRFAGIDRINGANDVTLGLTSRLINDNTGNEVSNFGLGYRVYLNSQNNLIYGSVQQYQQLYLPQPTFVAELTNKWAYHISSYANFQYDNLFNNIDAYNFKIGYNPDYDKVINLAYSYQYQLPRLYYAWTPGQGQAFTPTNLENQYALTASFAWPIFTNHVLLDGAIQYDLTVSQKLYDLVGLEYNGGGCWSLQGAYQEYLINVNQYAYIWMLQLHLKGLGSPAFGASPDDVLTSYIPNYQPIAGFQ